MKPGIFVHGDSSGAFGSHSPWPIQGYLGKLQHVLKGGKSAPSAEQEERGECSPALPAQTLALPALGVLAPCSLCSVRLCLFFWC